MVVVHIAVILTAHPLIPVVDSRFQDNYMGYAQWQVLSHIIEFQSRLIISDGFHADPSHDGFYGLVGTE